jgi:hypothetical protein
MNNPPTHPDDRMPEWHDPFGEPHTVPGGWDYAGLTATRPDAPARPRPQASPQASRKSFWAALLGATRFAAN